MKDYMTIKELADYLELDESTVRKEIKKILPNKIKNGIKTKLSKEEVSIYIDARKVGIRGSEVSQDNTGASQNNTIDNISFMENMLKTLSVMASELKSQRNDIAALKQKQQLLEDQSSTITQDYYSILAYCKLHDIKITFSEAIAFGKTASKLSQEKEYEIRKIPDERFGKVNSYHIKILESVFAM